MTAINIYFKNFRVSRIFVIPSVRSDTCAKVCIYIQFMRAVLIRAVGSFDTVNGHLCRFFSISRKQLNAAVCSGCIVIRDLSADMLDQLIGAADIDFRMGISADQNRRNKVCCRSHDNIVKNKGRITIVHLNQICAVCRCFTGDGHLGIFANSVFIVTLFVSNIIGLVHTNNGNRTLGNVNLSANGVAGPCLDLVINRSTFTALCTQLDSVVIRIARGFQGQFAICVGGVSVRGCYRYITALKGHAVDCDIDDDILMDRHFALASDNDINNRLVRIDIFLRHRVGKGEVRCFTNAGAANEPNAIGYFLTTGDALTISQIGGNNTIAIGNGIPYSSTGSDRHGCFLLILTVGIHNMQLGQLIPIDDRIGEVAIYVTAGDADSSGRNRRFSAINSDFANATAGHFKVSCIDAVHFCGNIYLTASEFKRAIIDTFCTIIASVANIEYATVDFYVCCDGRTRRTTMSFKVTALQFEEAVASNKVFIITGLYRKTAAAAINYGKRFAVVNSDSVTRGFQYIFSDQLDGGITVHSKNISGGGITIIQTTKRDGLAGRNAIHGDGIGGGRRTGDYIITRIVNFCILALRIAVRLDHDGAVGDVQSAVKLRHGCGRHHQHRLLVCGCRLLLGLLHNGSLRRFNGRNFALCPRHGGHHRQKHTYCKHPTKQFLSHLHLLFLFRFSLSMFRSMCTCRSSHHNKKAA